MIDYTPFIIGALFGFGAGFMIAHYMHRLPKLTSARKAAKTRRINIIKGYVKNYIETNRHSGYSVGAALIQYKEWSPELYKDITNQDLEQIARELGQEEALERTKGNHNV